MAKSKIKALVMDNFFAGRRFDIIEGILIAIIVIGVFFLVLA